MIRENIAKSTLFHSLGRLFSDPLDLATHSLESLARF